MKDFIVRVWKTYQSILLGLYHKVLLSVQEFISINITCIHQVGARFVTVSIVTSVNVPSIILDYDS